MRHYFDKLINRAARMFVRSSHVHLRLEPIDCLEDIVHLIDRFLDGRLNYDMEWDDFISWEYNDKSIAEVQGRIGKFEPFLFSDDRADRDVYARALIGERNRLAADLKLPLR